MRVTPRTEADLFWRVRARIGGNEYRLEVDPLADRAQFRSEYAEIDLEYSSHRPLGHRLFENVDEAFIDMRNYFIASSVLRGVLNPRYVNYINVEIVSGRGFERYPFNLWTFTKTYSNPRTFVLLRLKQNAHQSFRLSILAAGQERGPK